MPPTLALLLWLILLLALLYFDPAKGKISLALWVPLIWFFIVASRLPSQWLGGQTSTVAQALEEGNPLDRSIDLVLIILAIGILLSRSFDWGGFFRRNFVLMTFLTFALVSVLWSDFAFVSLKRWFRDLGNYLVILVALSDPRPLEAVSTLLRRLCYLLIPLSILLIKYYPALSKQYDSWTGVATLSGATTSKNMLGAVCLISAIFFLWDTVKRWPDRKAWHTRKIIVVNFALIAMTLWLLNLARSATCQVCLVIGCLVILAVQSRWGRHHTGFIRVMIPACFCLYLILAFGFDLNGQLASAVGRDPTLTDRTLIWKAVLSMHTNPLVGTGYESFWMGPRLEMIWPLAGHVNEAHNGYLEVYLNLGLLGVALIVGLLLASYRNICRKLTSPGLASLNLALWSIMLFYNMTEAAFKFHLMWLTFLLAAIAVPEYADERAKSAAEFGNAGVRRRVPRLPLETASRVR